MQLSRAHVGKKWEKKIARKFASFYIVLDTERPDTIHFHSLETYPVKLTIRLLDQDTIQVH